MDIVLNGLSLLIQGEDLMKKDDTYVIYIVAKHLPMNYYL